jgi:hypothetical protein
VSVNDPANRLRLPSFFLGDSPDFPDAKCVGENIDPDQWFIADDPMASRIAKSACAMCPYGPLPKGDDSCFEWAIRVEAQDGYEAFGIFGGRDAAYRQRLLDRKKYLDDTGRKPRHDEFWGRLDDE